jgi:DNA-directed RNA polymerase subunit RPC12/RpoP
MQITYRCPRCEETTRAEVGPDADAISCRYCSAKIDLADTPRAADSLSGCLICRSQDLFLRKDFPQRLGVLLVVIGFVASSIAWYYYQVILAFAILFATAGLDVLLYVVMGEALVCYRCGAHYRNVANLQGHGGFDLETHERYRQMAAREREIAKQSR